MKQNQAFVLCHDLRTSGGNQYLTPIGNSSGEFLKNPPFGIFHHVAFSSESSGTKIYLNKNIVAESSTTFWTADLDNVNAVYIGRWERTIPSNLNITGDDEFYVIFKNN